MSDLHNFMTDKNHTSPLPTVPRPCQCGSLKTVISHFTTSSCSAEAYWRGFMFTGNWFSTHWPISRPKISTMAGSKNFRIRASRGIWSGLDLSFTFLLRLYDICGEIFDAAAKCQDPWWLCLCPIYDGKRGSSSFSARCGLLVPCHHYNGPKIVRNNVRG